MRLVVFSAMIGGPSGVVGRAPMTIRSSPPRELAMLVCAGVLVPACRAATPAPRSLVAERDPRTDFRPTPWEPFAPELERPIRAVVTDVLCSGEHERCASTCKHHFDPVQL